MATSSFSNRQIEVINLLHSVEDIPADVSDEIVAMLGEAEAQVPDSVAPIEDIETAVKWRLMHEPDWRKRAAMSAMLISRSLGD